MKNTLLITLASVFLLFACKDKEPIPNRPPGEFTVKSTLGTDGKTVTLNWTKAKDPDGDAVTYTVVLGKDTLAKGLTDTLFVVQNLDFDFSGSGSVVAYDTKKVSITAGYSISTAVSPDISIVDEGFEKALILQGVDQDKVVNGKISQRDVKGVKIISVPDLFIKSLSGIEKFTDLEVLFVGKNLITNLDVSQNLKLKKLTCFSNQLSNLDLRKNINLEYLEINGNYLKSLDISNNLKLEYLSLFEISLGSINVSNNVKLTRLECNDIELMNLDVSKNINLLYLSCRFNSLSLLDLSNNTLLKVLKCDFNKLTKLEVIKNTRLTELQCSYNSIGSLDLRNNPSLEELYCKNNPIVTICVADIAKAKANKDWQKDATAEYKTCN
jgi:hypothetical protein